MKTRVSLPAMFAAICLAVASGCGASSNPAGDHTLRVSKTGSGTGRVTGGGLDCGDTCTVTLPNGTSVLLTAAPSGTSSLTGWSGCDGTSGAVCSVMLNTDRQVTVEFACSRQCATRSCGDDGCGGTCGTCPGGQSCNTSGQCVGCTPSCTGKTCGDNGCGGSCGTCATGQTCNASGQCVPCTPSCTGKSCGSDGCGGSCGTCTAGQTCNAAGQCVCAPVCTGKSCGSDGCGGSCGTCPSGQACSAAGQCVCTPNCSGRQCGPDPSCNTSCGTCSPGQVCNVSGQCTVCTPNCTGRQCGPDPVCNASCGTCPAGQTCSAAGQCACTPSCTGKSCGSDGCGGTCGTCPAGQNCNAGGQCVACTPNCTGRQCGPDPVCQTSCGTCTGTDQACDSSGRCVLVCPTGSGDCDANAANGCETNLLTDLANCGACGHACALPHATAACTSGSCSIATCDSGYGSCDGVGSNGCETSLTTDTNHCGSCPQVCGAGQICSGGTCQAPAPTCSDGVKNGQETDVDCGGPDCSACGPGQTCAGSLDCAAGAFCWGPGSTCVCASGYGDCDGNPSNGCEANLLFDANHCGSCSNACGAGQSCTGGTCGFDVTIWAMDDSVPSPGWQSVSPILVDGYNTGYSTPHTFRDQGSHTFTVPSTDPCGHSFTGWDTGATSAGITITSGGTYTAHYGGSHQVTIWAMDDSVPPPGWVSVAIAVDGLSMGQTPATFTRTGTHTFMVPSLLNNGHTFAGWDNGETSTTLTTSCGGTFTAHYH